MYLTITGTHRSYRALFSGVLKLAKGEFSRRSHQSSINLMINSPSESTEKPLERADSEETSSLMHSGIVTHLWLCK